MTNQPQKIVALVDGSIYSASVCDHAAWIASRTGAPVELIHVLGRREAEEGTVAVRRLGSQGQEIVSLDEIVARRRPPFLSRDEIDGEMRRLRDETE